MGWETENMAHHTTINTGMGMPLGVGVGISCGPRLPSTDHLQFPVGMRVLVVDDDPTCLKILDKMLKRCLYQVTTCCRATDALSMLRERKGGFDLVISDVYMPDMDGFKLLEHVGLEMDLPVIMMSADGGTSTVMKGVKHGACDYLIKPIRLEELKNIWQHVVRKKRNESKDFDHSGSVEDNERHRKSSDEAEFASSVNEGMDGNWKLIKKRNKEEEDDGEQENEDPSASKKPRVVWSVELHQNFVNAVSQLGIEKAVPKRILELMNVQGLTRENVASHLQKYRLYLKRLNGVTQQQGGLNSSFGGTTEPNVGSMGLLGRFDLQRLAASGQISPQALVTLPAELLGRVNVANGLSMSNVEQTLLWQAALQGANPNPVNKVRFGQPLNCQGNLHQGLPSGLELKQFAHPQHHITSFSSMGSSINDSTPGFSILPQQLSTGVGFSAVDQGNGVNNNGTLNPQNSAIAMKLIQQQQQQQLQTPASHQGAQLQGVQVLDLSSSNLIGVQVPPNDNRGRANAISSLANSGSSMGNNIIGTSGSGQLNHIPTLTYGFSASDSTASEVVGRTSCAEYKNQNISILQGNDYSIPSTTCVSAPLTSINTESGMSISGIKRLGDMSDIVSSSPLSGLGMTYGTSTGIGQNAGQSSRLGWQAQNVSGNQDLSQTATTVLSPQQGQAYHGNQGLIAPGMQDHGHIRNLGFVGKGPNIQSRLASNARSPRMLSNTSSQIELMGHGSGVRVKSEGVSDFASNERNTSSMHSEQYSSDDLLNLIFRQQQEALGLAEGEFSLDGYQLDDIHVQ